MAIAAYYSQLFLRKRVLWTFCALLLLIASVWFATRQTSISYGGKSINDWFEMSSGKTKHLEIAKVTDTESGYEAFQAFREIGSEALPFLEAKTRSERSGIKKFYADAIRLIPSTIRKKLPRVYGDGYYETQRTDALRLILMIAKHGELSVEEKFGARWPSVSQTICKSLTDRSPEVRAVAAEFIWKTDTAQFFTPNLVRATDDLNREVQANSLLALNTLNKTASNAIPCFCAVAADKKRDSAIRGIALEGLGNMGRLATAAVPAISHLLDEDDPKLKEDAAVALAKIGSTPPTVKNALLKLSKSENPRARSAALFALWRLEPASVEFESQIIAQLQSNSFEDKLFTLDFLQSCGPEASVFATPVRGVFNDADSTIRNLATNTHDHISVMKP